MGSDIWESSVTNAQLSCITEVNVDDNADQKQLQGLRTGGIHWQEHAYAC